MNDQVAKSDLPFTAYACVGCGYCCRKHFCGAASRRYKRDYLYRRYEDGLSCPLRRWCWREKRYRCQIAMDGNGKEIDAGEGCSSSLNTDRQKIPTPKEAGVMIREVEDTKGVKAWLPEVVDELESFWSETFREDEITLFRRLIPFRAKLQARRDEIRKAQGRKALVCPKCGGPTTMTVGAVLFALKRFKMVTRELYEALYQEWKRYRRNNKLDPCGKPKGDD